MKSLASHKMRAWKRAEKGRVFKSIADECQVTDSAVSFWINGDRVPHAKHMAKLQVMGICEPNDWFRPAPNAVDSGDMERAA